MNGIEREIAAGLDGLAGAAVRKMHITDLTPRDGQQCKLATRVRTDDLLPLCEKMDGVGFYAVEVWGGATYDVCLRYLREDPWERLRLIRQVMPKTKLQMLFRGQNIVGYRPRNDKIVRKFAERAVENGIRVFRVFDSLNDNRNIETAVRAIREFGGEVHAEISYNVSPAHTYERWMAYARELADMGPDWISFKDATGILMPFDAYRIIQGIKRETGGRIPVLFHSHDMNGLAVANQMMAILAGVDMVDTVLSPLAYGSSHPATEAVVAALQGTPFDTGIELHSLDPLADEVREIRRKYARYETEYSGVNAKALIHKVPGGMISNMVAQLAEAGASDRMEEALLEVPRVAADLGHPPLLTPSSQIVGVQAVLNTLSGSRYGKITKEVRAFVEGRYGRPPAGISHDLAVAVLGPGRSPDYTSRAGDTADPDEWERSTEEIGSLARSDEDRLLHVLFPMQAREFLTMRNEGKLAGPSGESVPTPADIAADRVPVEFDLVYHGEKLRVKVEGASTHVGPRGAKKYYVRVGGRLEEIQLTPYREISLSGRAADAAAPVGEGGIPKASLPGDVSPVMSGKVCRILVAPEQKVEKDQPVALVEAMKMESEIPAPIAGIVSRIFAKAGDPVEKDDAILRIEAP